jgi:MFS family permease
MTSGYITLSRLRQLPRNIWAVTATSFLTDISSEMVFNLLPLYLSNVVGARTSVIGVIEGLAESTASLLKMTSGWFSDRVGKRKPLAVLGYGVSTVSKPFLYFAATWWGVLVIRVSDRVGKGIRTAPRDALVADSIDQHQRGMAFGIHRAGDTAGALLGLVLALVVVWAEQTDALTLSRATFQAVVLLSVIPAALAVVVLALVARDIPAQGDQAEKPSVSLRGFEPTFRRFLVVALLFTLGNSADAFLILRAQERGLNVLGILGLLITFNFVYTVVSGPAGALSDRVGRRRLIIGGWLIYGTLYLGFALVTRVWQMWVLYACYGIYYGATEGTAKAFVADIVQPHQYGTAYGAYNAVVGAAAFPASVIAGVLWQGVGAWSGWGPRAPFLFGALLALVAVGLFRFWVPAGITQNSEDSGA